MIKATSVTDYFVRSLLISLGMAPARLERERETPAPNFPLELKKRQVCVAQPLVPRESEDGGGGTAPLSGLLSNSQLLLVSTGL